MKIPLILGAVLLAGMAYTQGQPVLYNPVLSIADQGIRLKSWGSGTISQTDETSFEGNASLRVSTRNLFQGGIIEFANPIDLTAAYNNKNDLLMLTVLIADRTLVLGGGAAGGGSGSQGDPDGGLGSGGALGGSGALGAPGRGGGPAAGQPTQVTRPEFEFIRLVITTTDGRKSEVYVPVTGGSTIRGWRRIAVPLTLINGFERTNKIVQSIAFSGDATGSFYIGEIRIINDTTPLRVELPTNEFNLALGDEVTFTAFGSGGASVLRYEWDFDASDGIQVDAEGQTVVRRFRRPGTFTVTVTVRDVSGAKEPATATATVVVNP